jgi:hypothetical protein
LQITVVVAEADEAPISAVDATAATSARPNTLIDLTLFSLLGAESAEVLCSTVHPRAGDGRNPILKELG